MQDAVDARKKTESYCEKEKRNTESERKKEPERDRDKRDTERGIKSRFLYKIIEEVYYSVIKALNFFS